MSSETNIENDRLPDGGDLEDIEEYAEDDGRLELVIVATTAFIVGVLVAGMFV